jgi:hypothetical protein
MPGQGTVFAFTKLAWGDGPNGEWKSLGFNVDGLTTTAASTNVCQPKSGAQTSTPYPDGNNGIDNSFGKNVLPLLLDMDPSFVTDVNNSITDGLFDALLKVDCLPTAGDATMLTTKAYAGTSLGAPPKFDGTDQWPVAPEFLSNPTDVESSTLVFPSCSVAGAAFDTGGQASQALVLNIPFQTNGMTTSLKLRLYDAHVTMTLAANRQSATGAVIGGVLDTEELVLEVKKVGYLLGICNNAIFPSLITAVRQASDIMSDGTQDATKTCNGISIGIGFEAKQVQLGGVGPATPAMMACP